MTYFTNFPVVSYQTKNGTVQVTDITRRFTVVKEFILDQKPILYDYNLKNNERPDTIAEKYYGDAKLDWLVMVVNEIHDPAFDWPLEDVELRDYLVNKYGSVEEAKRTERAFYRKINAKLYRVDELTFYQTPVNERFKETYYEWEIERNQAKRQIQILDKSYVPLILQELKEMYG